VLLQQPRNLALFIWRILRADHPLATRFQAPGRFRSCAAPCRLLAELATEREQASTRLLRVCWTWSAGGRKRRRSRPQAAESSEPSSRARPVTADGKANRARVVQSVGGACDRWPAARCRRGGCRRFKRPPVGAAPVMAGNVTTVWPDAQAVASRISAVLGRARNLQVTAGATAAKAGGPASRCPGPAGPYHQQRSCPTSVAPDEEAEGSTTQATPVGALSSAGGLVKAVLSHDRPARRLPAQTDDPCTEAGIGEPSKTSWEPRPSRYRSPPPGGARLQHSVLGVMPPSTTRCDTPGPPTAELTRAANQDASRWTRIPGIGEPGSLLAWSAAFPARCRH